MAKDLLAAKAPKDLFAQQPSQPQEQSPMSWADVPGQAFDNLGSSAVKFGEDMVQPLMEPMQTLDALKNVALGGVQKLIPGEQSSEKYADAVGDFIASRYGSEEAFKKTIAQDPVGVLADFSTVLSGGGTLAARAPGMAGKIGKIAQTAGKAVDPLNVAAKGVGQVGKRVLAPVASTVAGTLTGAGPQAIQGAAKAGFRGGDEAVAFKDQMREIAPVEDVVTDAKTALGKMSQERGAEYRAGMQELGKSEKLVDFGPIEDRLGKISDIGMYKGEVIKPGAKAAMDDVLQVINEWRLKDPVEFHTPEGMDALKQKIYAVGEKFDPMKDKQARIAVDQAYNAVKDEIVKQAPEYAKVMKDYERASSLIQDIEKTLSVNPKANVDTTVRKLQSIMRNNANTNYGRRADLGEKLAEAGAPNLMPKLSGQALSSLAPRGIQGATSALGGIGMGASAVSGGLNPLTLLLLGATSPRLVGETAYYGGKAGKLGKRAAQLAAPMAGHGPRLGAYQSGRLAQELNKEYNQ